MIGSVAVLACLIVMAWTKELVALFINDGPTAKTCTIWIAVLSIYAVDFVINAGICPGCAVHKSHMLINVT